MHRFVWIYCIKSSLWLKRDKIRKLHRKKFKGSKNCARRCSSIGGCAVSCYLIRLICVETHISSGRHQRPYRGQTLLCESCHVMFFVSSPELLDLAPGRPAQKLPYCDLDPAAETRRPCTPTPSVFSLLCLHSKSNSSLLLRILFYMYRTLPTIAQSHAVISTRVESLPKLSDTCQDRN